MLHLIDSDVAPDGFKTVTEDQNAPEEFFTFHFFHEVQKSHCTTCIIKY